MPMLPKVIVVKSRHGGIWSLFRSRRTCIAPRRDATYEFVDPKIIATLEVGPQLPFVHVAAKVRKEPNLTDAAESINGWFVENPASYELGECL